LGTKSRCLCLSQRRVTVQCPLRFPRRHPDPAVPNPIPPFRCKAMGQSLRLPLPMPGPDHSHHVRKSFTTRVFFWRHRSVTLSHSDCKWDSENRNWGSHVLRRVTLNASSPSPFFPSCGPPLLCTVRTYDIVGLDDHFRGAPTIHHYRTCCRVCWCIM
jgi:hypothetical protein